jgi:hypothetical protein
MIKEAVRTCALLSSILLFQLGCATVEIGQEANESSIIVKDLVKTTKSWDGKSLSPYPQGQPEPSQNHYLAVSLVQPVKSFGDLGENPKKLFPLFGVFEDWVSFIAEEADDEDLRLSYQGNSKHGNAPCLWHPR